MTWQVIAVPSGFMDSVQSIVNGLVGTISAWFPQLLLLAIFVGIFYSAVAYIRKATTKSSHGRA